MSSNKEPSAFKPQWPDGLVQGQIYRVMCDDKGRDGGTWVQVLVANDGDCHISMQDWEEIKTHGTKPSQFPDVRIRTHAGGGKNHRTRQALLWLADAIRRDNEENGLNEFGEQKGGGDIADSFADSEFENNTTLARKEMLDVLDDYD